MKPCREKLMTTSSAPRIFWILQRRIAGDDSLLSLARHRLEQAGAGAEFYASSPDELRRLLRFRPGPEGPVIVHLPRDINLLDSDSRRLIVDFAGLAAREKIYGLVLHDHHQMTGLFSDYTGALQKLNTALEHIPGGPFLFVEYAAMLAPHFFCDLLKNVRSLEKISACVDIGHLGIRQIGESFRKVHREIDILSLTALDPRLPGLIHDLDQSVRSVLPATLEVVQALGSLGKPLHFHLHDGHPLSTFSRFGFSDHISFFAEIPIPFPYHGKVSLPPMYGMNGLAAVVREALHVLRPGQLTFTLEIHPLPGYLHLSDVGHLFRHWQDKTNAEQMNYWLMILLQHHNVLQSIFAEAAAS
jgi:hypothetical protein